MTALQSQGTGTLRARFLPILTTHGQAGLLKRKPFKLALRPCALAMGRGARVLASFP